MNTAIPHQTPVATCPSLPARRLNLGAAALSLVLTSAVLGAVVFGMDAKADRRALMSATSTTVQAG